MKIIYDGLIQTPTRKGRQYENSCDLCVNLKRTFNISNEMKVKCLLYPAMENGVRCIQYVGKRQTIQTQFFNEHTTQQ